MPIAVKPIARSPVPADYQPVCSHEGTVALTIQTAGRRSDDGETCCMLFLLELTTSS